MWHLSVSPLPINHLAFGRTAREIREHYIPGDFQNWKDHDAFETAFAKLLKDLRASDQPNP